MRAERGCGCGGAVGVAPFVEAHGAEAFLAAVEGSESGVLSPSGSAFLQSIQSPSAFAQGAAARQRQLESAVEENPNTKIPPEAAAAAVEGGPANKRRRQCTTCMQVCAWVLCSPSEKSCGGAFGWESAHAAVSRRPPIPLHTMVPD
jgi:hypothetical protein